MIASGNTFVNTKQKQQTDGLMKCASAFGIVGKKWIPAPDPRLSSQATTIFDLIYGLNRIVV